MKPLRVLIMEDEPIIAMLLSEVLGEMGHEVCGTEFDRERWGRYRSQVQT